MEPIDSPEKTLNTRKLSLQVLGGILLWELSIVLFVVLTDVLFRIMLNTAAFSDSQVFWVCNIVGVILFLVAIYLFFIPFTKDLKLFRCILLALFVFCAIVISDFRFDIMNLVGFNGNWEREIEYENKIFKDSFYSIAYRVLYYLRIVFGISLLIMLVVKRNKKTINQ